MNGDTNADLAFGQGSSVSVMLGDGTGGFSGPTTYSTGGSGQGDVAVTDVNGDSKPDLAVTSEIASTVSVFLGDGSGGFAPAVNYGAPFGPIGLAAGLFNADGTPDFVGASQSGAKVLLSAVPQLSISANNAQLEGDTGTKNFTFTVGASAASVEPVSVDFQTMDGLATAASGDYVPAAATDVHVSPGQVSRTSPYRATVTSPSSRTSSSSSSSAIQ